LLQLRDFDIEAGEIRARCYTSITEHSLDEAVPLLSVHPDDVLRVVRGVDVEVSAAGDMYRPREAELNRLPQNVLVVGADP